VIPLAGLAMFAATNIDGLFLTAALLSDRAFRARDVVLGTYAGIGALYAVSVLGSLVSLVVPASFIALLGIVPIAMGLMHLRKREREAAVAATRSGIWTVTALNVATGADNVGVYTPVFAASSAQDIAAYGAIFALLLALWCWAAYSLVHHPELGAPVRRYGPRLVPYVLMALGLWILSGLF
jgi:cadmium resistance protein CadD (predicted permease)